MKRGFGFCVLSLMLAGCAMSPKDASVKLRKDQVQVQEGDTIYSIARRHNISPRQLMDANNLTSSVIHPGEILQITAAQAKRLTPAPYVPLSEGEAAGVRSEIEAATPLAIVSTETSEGPKEAQIEQRDIDYLWPVQGNVVVPFGRAKGARSLGIFVEAPAGTPVRASKAGEIVYAGNDLKDYGNMVLVRHDDGSVTAYGQLEDVDVKQGDTVGQGQPLATLAGVSSDNPTGRLYFELRKPKDEGGAKPKAVNPLPHLAN